MLCALPRRKWPVRLIRKGAPKRLALRVGRVGIVGHFAFGEGPSGTGIKFKPSRNA